MNPFHLRIFAADRVFYDGECVSLILPFSDGAYGIQAHHRNTVAALIPGEAKYRLPDGTWQTAALSRGIVRVERNDVLVLVGTAEHPDEIDEVRAERSAREARAHLVRNEGKRDYVLAQAQLARALNRLRVRRQGEAKN